MRNNAAYLAACVAAAVGAILPLCAEEVAAEDARAAAQGWAELRVKRGADMKQRLDASAVVLHDSHGEASNLCGAFDRVRRNLQRVRLHFA